MGLESLVAVGQVWHDKTWCVQEWQALRGMSGKGTLRSGLERQAGRGEETTGEVTLGVAGKARSAQVSFGKSRQAI